MCKRTIGEEKVIEDSSDILLNSGDELHYVIHRHMECKSDLYIEMVNLFGKMGGFTKIIDRIKNNEKVLDFELMYYYCDIVGMMTNLYTRQFAIQIVPVYKEAVINYIIHAPDTIIRKMAKDRFDRIVKSVEKMMIRVYTSKTKNELVDKFIFDVYILFFKSSFLERRIQGLKGINDYCKNVRHNMSRSIESQELTEWISNNQILGEIFGENKHVQLIQRSSEIIKFLIHQQLFTKEDLALIWESSKGEAVKHEIYKVLSDCALYFRNIEYKFFLQRLSEIDLSQITVETLDFIAEMARFMPKSNTLLEQSANLLWSIACSNEISPSITSHAITKFAESIKEMDTGAKVDILAKCIQDIDNVSRIYIYIYI